MSVGAVGCSLLVISARNPVVSVLALLGSFVCLATIYLLAGFQFMAAAQLLVYAGAIMVLFLFVIMLLNLGGEDARPALDRDALRARRLPLVASIAAAVGLLTMFGIQSQQTVRAVDPELAERGVSSFKGLAELMFSTYLLPFEAASVLLLGATIAVIVLAKRQRAAVVRETLTPAHAAPAAPAPTPAPAAELTRAEAEVAS